MHGYRLFGKFDFVHSPALFTPWSLMHFTSGVVSRSLLESRDRASFLHALYESKDFFFAYVMKKGLNPEKEGNVQNSWLNSIGDQIAFEIGSRHVKRTLMKKELVMLVLATYAMIASPMFSEENEKTWNARIWFNRG